MSGLITVASLPEITVDVDGLDAAATTLSQQAGLVSPATEDVVARWGRLGSHYDAPETEALISKMGVVGTAGDDFTESLSSVASTLSTCAEALAGAKQRLETLAAEIPPFRASVASYRSDQAELMEVDESGAGDVWGPGQYERHLDLVNEREAIRTLIQAAVDEATADLSAVADPAGLTALSGAADQAALGTSWAAAQTSFDADLGRAVLDRLALSDPEAVERLVEEHPEWVDHLREHPPEPGEALDWWNGLAEDGGTRSPVQSALVLGAPAIIGALGGVPLPVRLEANRHNAEDELARVRDRQERAQESLDEYLEDRHEIYSRDGVDDPEEERLRAAVSAFDDDVDYLKRATTPTEDGTYAVQLVLYDPDHARIVQMFGTPSRDTTTTITYSPGTATTIQSFYHGRVQQVSDYLSGQDDETVAFVWMDGEFPGGSEGENIVHGLSEANETDFALRKGRDLASFQDVVHTDPWLGSTYDVGIGHSWGLAAVTGSEVANAQYDQVESLAGAYMPPGWEARPDTQYSHQSYRDFLSIAQYSGMVGGGNNPSGSPDFDSEILTREGDFTWYVSDGDPQGMSLQPPPGFDVTVHPQRNHELIASQEAENLGVLDSIYQRIGVGRDK